MLESISVPLFESLRDLDKRLRKYSSLGTKAPGICDQVGWAWEGGVGLRQKLDSQINSLNIFNTSSAFMERDDELTDLQCSGRATSWRSYH